MRRLGRVRPPLSVIMEKFELTGSNFSMITRKVGERLVRRRRFRDGHGVLLRDGEPIAPLEIAASYHSRTRGLLGRDGIEGAILLTPSASVHTVRMRFGIDVAYLGSDLRVISVVSMRPNRVGMVRLRARHVLEAEWGAFDRWDVRPGTKLTVAGQRTR